MLEVLRYRVFDALTDKHSYNKFQDLINLQYYSYSQLLDMQNSKLRRIVNHAYTNTAYYRALFDNMDIHPSDIRTRDDLSLVPILTKDIIKSNKSSFKAKNYSSYRPRERATSGSTGKAFHFTIDRETHSWVHGYMLLAWNVAGFEFGDKVLTIGSGNVKLPRFKRAVLSFLKNSKDLSSFHLDDPALRKIIYAINNTKPGLIYGYSSALSYIAKYSQDHSIPLYSPKGIVTTAENLLPHNRRRIEQAFSAKVFDQYGVMESGLTAFECEYHRGYHLGMTKGIVETVNGAGDRVSETPGRILSSDLDNFAFPILRYDTGDIGTISGKQCSCKRGFELLDSIQGRTREFLTADNGKKVHGAVFSYLVRENPWIVQYFVYQKVPGVIHVSIVADCKVDETKKGIIQAFVEEKCKGGMKAEVVQVDRIPASSNNKRHFVISEITNI